MNKVYLKGGSLGFIYTGGQIGTLQIDGGMEIIFSNEELNRIDNLVIGTTATTPNILESGYYYSSVKLCRESGIVKLNNNDITVNYCKIGGIHAYSADTGCFQWWMGMGTGKSAATEYGGQTFQPLNSGQVYSIVVPINKVGSPSDQIYMEIWSESGGSPNQLLGTSDYITTDAYNSGNVFSILEFIFSLKKSFKSIEGIIRFNFTRLRCVFVF
jgi:hypothetical protein